MTVHCVIKTLLVGGFCVFFFHGSPIIWGNFEDHKYLIR